MSFDLGGLAIDEGWATILAAAIGAVCSTGSLWILMLNKRSIAAAENYAEEKKEARKKMRDLVHHLNQIEMFSSDLISKSSHLSPQQLVQEATHTLAIVSNYFRATESDKTIDFPDSLLKLLDSIRGKIATLFLSLDISTDRKKDIEIIEASMRDLSIEIARCRAEIRGLIKPKFVI